MRYHSIYKLTLVLETLDGIRKELNITVAAYTPEAVETLIEKNKIIFCKEDKLVSIQGKGRLDRGQIGSHQAWDQEILFCDVVEEDNEPMVIQSELVTSITNPVEKSQIIQPGKSGFFRGGF